jgi:hypothetical protein
MDKSGGKFGKSLLFQEMCNELQTSKYVQLAGDFKSDLV